MNKEILTLKEAMAYLNVKSYATLRKFVKEGLPVIVIGKAKRFNRSDLDNFIKAHTVTTK